MFNDDSTTPAACDVRKSTASCRFHPQHNLTQENKELRVNAELFVMLVITSVSTTVRPGWR